jgi:hypothetical protein
VDIDDVPCIPHRDLHVAIISPSSAKHIRDHPQRGVADLDHNREVGETLMDITPGLPETDNFQHWQPWRPLVVETARRVLDYIGGTLVMPMTVLVEPYWREISTGLAQHGIPVRHFVLHADRDTLRRRIEGDTPIPSPFRLEYLEEYAEAARTWLHSEAEVVDTTYVTAAQAALQITEAIRS